ncbi:MAG: hypothetical protein WDO56_21590 [Gammaproteobacteria bacterium]
MTQPARASYASRPITTATSEARPGRHANLVTSAQIEPGDVAAAPVAIFDSYWATTLAFTSSLGKRGVPMHFYGSSGGGRWSRYCARRAPCPPVQDAEKFLPWLEARIRSGEITRVAPTTDLIAYYISLLRDLFPPEVRRTIAPVSETEGCLIKTRFATLCEQIGQPTPATADAQDIDGALAAAERLGYPLILKPKSHLVVGFDERGDVVNDAAELRRAFRRYRIAPGQEMLARQFPDLLWPLLQKYIPAARTSVFSVSGFKDADGGIIAASLSCKRKQWPPDTGISTSQISCNDQRVLDAGLAAVDRLVSCGIFELELLVSGDELLAIDLNPRAFGFLSLDISLGNDLPWLWFASTLRILSAPTELPGRRPVVEARLLIPYWLGRTIARVFSLGVANGAALEQDAASRTVSMLGQWSDPLPMLMSNLRLLRHPGGLVRPYLRAAIKARRNGSQLSQQHSN